jgi:hypothetical protein
MTEKESLEIKIKHLEERKRLMISEIDFELRQLHEGLALQKGFERGGKHGFQV